MYAPLTAGGFPCGDRGRSSPQESCLLAKVPTCNVTNVATSNDATHGAPVHIGDPSQIGIRDINKPDWGSPVTIKPGEVPIFWARGVTPQAATLEAKMDFMITHSPGHMFVTDLKDERLTAL